MNADMFYELAKRQLTLINFMDDSREQVTAVEYLKLSIESSIKFDFEFKSRLKIVDQNHPKRYSVYAEDKSISEVLYDKRLEDTKYNTNNYKKLVKLFEGIESDRKFKILVGQNYKSNYVFDLLSKYFTDDDDDKDGDHDEQ
ncbi:hypothetical protein ACLUXR_00490 [Limosilactobacillus reuteri subsp. suis]|uniref:hypothetical protein n=1 Tax=Limosilactobacillus reuteri TaxID=1598 RepID=UPI0039953BD2